MTRIGKIQFLGLLMLTAAIGAFAGGTWEADGDGYHRIPDIGTFQGVVNATAADVIIRSGAEHSIRTTGDSTVLQHFQVDVKDGQLRIRNPWRPWYLLSYVRGRQILLEVTAPEVSSVKVTGSGKVTVEDPMSGDTLYLRTTGSGGLTATGNADFIEITINGSGDIEFAGSCEEADLGLTGPGELDLELEARAIEARVTGSGDISIGGSAGELRLRLTGPGRFQGDDFTATTADITIHGSADAILAVEQELTARLTGSGDLRLTEGSPEIESRTTGRGRVIIAGE